jgi:hypothetical protein
MKNNYGAATIHEGNPDEPFNTKKRSQYSTLGRSLEDQHLLIVTEAEEKGRRDIARRANHLWSRHVRSLGRLAEELVRA